MAKWLKLYAIYTFQPNLTHVTTLPCLNAGVVNFCLTLDLFSHVAQIWCQGEEGILLRQLSCLVATARHAHFPRTSFFVFQQNGVPQRIENKTPSLSCSETETESHRLSAYFCVRAAHFEQEF